MERLPATGGPPQNDRHRPLAPMTGRRTMATAKKAAKKSTKKPAAKKTAAKKPAAKKSAAKKSAPKKAPAAKKPAKKSAAKRKPNAAFMKAMTPSATLAAVIG